MLENLLFYWASFLAFYFGAIMGSFLNVVSLELEKTVFDENVKDNFLKRINRRSHCPSCGHQLKFWELFPIFSYIFLKGKCSVCGAKISQRYFWVELFSGILFLSLFFKLFHGNFDFNFISHFLELSIIFSGFILVFLFDWKHKIIPDEVYIPTLILTFIYIFLNHLFSWNLIITASLSALPFFLLWLLSKGKMIGYADWKLIFLLSLFFHNGFQIYSYLTLAFWVGAFLYVLPLLVMKREYKANTEIPFGPFLLIGFWFVFLFNIDVLAYTQKLLSYFY